MGEYIQYEKYGSMGDYAKSLEEIAEKERNKKNKILLTSGVFDILHPGHVTFFKKIKEEYLGSLFVNIANDARVKYRKGAHKPVNSSYNRALVVAGLEMVNYVTVHPEEKSSPAWKLASIIKPDYMIQSWPWTKEERKELESLVSPLPKLISFPLEFPGTTHSSKQYKKILKSRTEEEAIFHKFKDLFKELLPRVQGLLTQIDAKSGIAADDYGLAQSLEELSKKPNSRENLAALVSFALKIKNTYKVSFKELDDFVSDLTEKYAPPKPPLSSNEQISPA